MHRIAICDADRAVCSALEEKVLKLCRACRIETEIDIWYEGENLCAYLQRDGRIDLLFLEVLLPGKGGIEIGQFVREKLKNYHMCIVYLAESAEHVANLFQNHPFDLLWKPLREKQLCRTFVHYLEHSGLGRHFFEYRVQGGSVKLICDDILYFSSYHKKIEVATVEGTREFYGQLKDVLPMLPGNFLMIHQSHIINWKHVQQYRYEEVSFADGGCLAISKRYRKEVRQRVLHLLQEQ